MSKGGKLEVKLIEDKKGSVGGNSSGMVPSNTSTKIDEVKGRVGEVEARKKKMKNGEVLIGSSGEFGKGFIEISFIGEWVVIIMFVGKLIWGYVGWEMRGEFILSVRSCA